MEEKTCIECNKSLPLHYFEFRKDNNKFRNICRKCSKGYLLNKIDNKLEIIELLKLNKKKCSRCLEIKDLEHFSKDIYTITKHSSNCKECIKLKSIENKDSIKNGRLKRKYNIDLELYNKLYNNQEGNCSICKRFYKVLSVDHCHTTSNFRGLLCFHCNAGLGMFNDNIEFMEEAINYLKISRI